MRCCRALTVMTVLVTVGCQRRLRPQDGGETSRPTAAADAPVVASSVDALGTGAGDAIVARGRSPAPRAFSPDPARALDLVTIKLLVEPPKRAHVFWGVKDLGVAPVELHRPRGSGPMDLALRAPGFLTHHTRVFTERDDTLSIRLSPETEGARYFGYQAPSEKAAPESKAKPGVTPGARANSKDNRRR